MVIGDTPHDVSCSRYWSNLRAVCTGYASPDAIAAESPAFMLDSLEDKDRVIGLLESHFKL